MDKQNLRGDEREKKVGCWTIQRERERKLISISKSWVSCWVEEVTTNV